MPKFEVKKTFCGQHERYGDFMNRMLSKVRGTSSARVMNTGKNTMNTKHRDSQNKKQKKKTQ